MTSYRLGTALLVLLSAACAGGEATPAQLQPAPLDSADVPVSTHRRDPRLSPLADSIAQALVFVPRDQTWFTGAARGKRMLLDIGRVDIEVRKDSARAEAYREVVARAAPLRVGARLRLHGPWGADDVEVTGFDTWSGRIVATLRVPPRVDSLAKHVEPLPVAAALADSAAASSAPPCARDSIPPEHRDRLAVVIDSLEQQLRAETTVPYDRLNPTIAVKTTIAHGCFGASRTLVLTSLRAGAFEFVRERVVLVSDAGAVIPVRIVGSRWRAHDAIYALDADGDGVDDLAVKGSSELAGGTVILRLVEGTRLEKLTGGFNWESR